MGLASLALQGVLLALVARVAVLVTGVSTVADHVPGRELVREERTRSDRYLRLVLFNHGLVHGVQGLEGQLDIDQKAVAAVHAEVLTDDNTHQFHLLAMGCHGVGRDNPSALAQLVGDGKLIVITVGVRGQTEGYQGQTLALTLAHDDHALVLQLLGHVVGNAGQIHHDGAVTVLAQADQLVILANNMGGTLGEVQSETSLVGSEIIDVEDQLLGQVLGRAPDDPTNTGVDQTVLVSGDVDGDDLLETEVPGQIGLGEGSDKATASGIDVDGAVNATLNKQVVDGLDVLILTSVGSTDNGTDTNCVLIHQIDSLLGVDDKAGSGTVDVLLLNIKVASGLLPTHLHGTVHDNVGTGVVLTLGLALVLPALLHGQSTEHDGLGGANGGGTHCVLTLRFRGAVEQTGNHVHAAVLDLGGVGVLLVVNKVLAERVGHDLLDFLFLQECELSGHQ